MNSILFWILPPIIGAFIGYFTNMVAVKMLFRPLKEVKVLRIRLPFTPGILPRERHTLADSIGNMVERELLTAGVLRERLEKPELREKLEGTMGSYTGQLLKRPLSELLNDSGGDKEAPSPLSELLKDFFNSEVFDSVLEEVIKTWAAGRTQNSVEDENSLTFWLKSRFRDFGAMFVPAAKDIIKGGIVKEVTNHAQGEPLFFLQVLENVAVKYPGITLGEFLSMGEKKKQRIDVFLADKTVTTLDDNLEEALDSIDVKTLVSDRINSLDMLKVEKIILDVMAGQLKWINVFGGILGALIGFAQVIISLFMGR